jgi:PAS domain S-box-containing protein
MRIFLLLALLVAHVTSAGADGVTSNRTPNTPGSERTPATKHQQSAKMIATMVQGAMWNFDNPELERILTYQLENADFLAIELQDHKGKPHQAAWRDKENKIVLFDKIGVPEDVRQHAEENISRPLRMKDKEFGRLILYVRKTDGALQLTTEERTHLEQKGVIRMCVVPDWLPYLAIGEQGKVVGIGADLVALMQERLRVKFELYPTKEWGDSLAAIHQRNCDILPLASDLPHRRDAMNFTRPYLTTPFVVATRNNEQFIRDSSEIGERPIGIVKDYSFAALMRSHYPNIQIVDVKNTKDGLDRVRSGEIWGYLDGMDSIAYTLQKYSMHDLKIDGKLEFSLDLSLASSKGDNLLAVIMQKATDSIGEEERRAIINKWISVRFEQGVDYSLLWKLGVAAMLLLLAGYAWNRRLTKLNRQLGLTQSTLRQTASELEAILDHAWIGIFVTSGERKVVRMNRYAAAEVFRCQPNAYIGLSTRSMFSSDEAYETFTKQVRAAATANVSVESTFCRKDGTPFLAKAVGSLLDPSDPGKGAIWLMTDITAQRADEEKLARTLSELEIIFQNASIGIVYVQNRRIVRVNSAFSEMTGFVESALIGQSTRIYYPSDDAWEAMGEAYVVLGDGQSTFKHEVMMRRANGTDFLCAITGSLVDPRDPAKGSIWLHQDITEQRVAEKKLTQTLSELDIIFRNVGIGIGYVKDRRFVRVNSALAKMMGYSESEMIGETGQLYLTEEAYQTIGRGYAEMAAGQTFTIEVPMRRADGTDFLCVNTGTLLDPDDPSRTSIWTYRDVTEQRAAEERLEQTLNEMEIIFENASVGIIYLVNRRFIRLNRMFETISGYSAAELLGQSTRKIYASEKIFESFLPHYAALSHGQQVVKTDAVLRKPDGSDVICELTGSLVDAKNPETGSIWLYRDMTEQRAAESNLAQTLNELDIIFNNASVGIVFNVNRRFVRINKTFENMFGWPVAELIGQETRRFYKSDEAWAAIGKAANELPTNERLRVDMEMLRADGSEVLCEGICSYVDPSDRAKGVVWLFTDITEFRRAQAALQQARDDALTKNALIEQQHQLVTRTLDQVATLLNNSGQGFLSFGKELVIEEGYSQECQRIFGRDVVDVPLPELLFAADTGQREFLEKALRLILGSADDTLRRDAYLGLLPAEYRLGDRSYKAEYRLLGDLRMMLILTDITDEKRLQERLSLERLRLEFVVNALENRDDLLEMLRDFAAFRSRVLPDLLSFERQPQALLAEAFRQVHTFKSLFAQASLPTTPEVLHELESRLGRLRELGEKLDTNAIKHELGATDLGAALAKDMALLREKLGDDFFNSEREIRVPASKLASLEVEASTLYGADSRMLELIRRLRYVPLQSLIEPHFKAAEQLAQRQEKLLAPITSTGRPVSVDPDVYGSFCKSLVHLFRNAIDHGIEDVDTRLLADKDEMATIRCEVSTAGDHLILTITDDGCGIDVEKIRAKAIEQRKVGAGDDVALGQMASMSDADAMLLIFADGITTSDTVTAISGRGVGLSAVQQELLHIGGTVRVESTLGQGTRLEFTLPYQASAADSKRADIYEDAKRILAPLPGIVKSFCETHLKLEVTVDETLHEFSADRLSDFTALISLGSGLNTRIGLSIERPLLLEMTRRFEPDFPEDEIEELADSVGAEIANTIVGNATVYFTHLAHHVAMGTPDIVAPNERSEKVGSRLFRGFTGHGITGAFMVFCILSEENSA